MLVVRGVFGAAGEGEVFSAGEGGWYGYEGDSRLLYLGWDVSAFY